MRIGPHSFEEYLALAAAFHGNPAPGLIIGGFMVEAAKARLPEGTIYDAVVETPKCLPDAVQLLTLCSIGNGWMKIVNLGRYAVTLYDKYNGEGARVWIDPDRLAAWPEIKGWFLKEKPKKEQDRERLMDEIRRAGADICSFAAVRVADRFLKKGSMGAVALCPVCGEAYPAHDGGICRACAGEAPYVEAGREDIPEPRLEPVPVAQAVGLKALHDMTRVVPGESKGPEFTAGQALTAGDVCRLQTMGRERVYVAELSDPGAAFVHENEAARAFGRAMAGEGVVPAAEPREGRVDFRATRDGLFVADKARLHAFNMVPDVMCGCRQSHIVVEEGKPVAGARAIPLYLARERLEAALRVIGSEPLFRVLPLKAARVGVLVTGTEVVKGLIEDRFAPIIESKVSRLGSRVTAVDTVPDDRAAIAAGVRGLLASGVDLIVTTAGLSVDPDDVTRKGLLDAGLADMLYGAPILPGAMTLLGRVGEVRVMGVPACALYHKTTSLDLLLPRVLAGVPITRKDLSEMADGSFCLNCRACTYPKCPFGK